MINKQQIFDLYLRPSRFFFTLISGLHLVLIFIICISDFTLDYKYSFLGLYKPEFIYLVDLINLWLLKLILIVFTTLSYLYLVNKYIYRIKNKFIKPIVVSLTNAKTKDNIIWYLKFNNNTTVYCDLDTKGYVSNYMIVLTFNMLSSSTDIYYKDASKTKDKLLKYKCNKKSDEKQHSASTKVLIMPDMIDLKEYHRLKLYLTGII